MSLQPHKVVALSAPQSSTEGIQLLQAWLTLQYGTQQTSQPDRLTRGDVERDEADGVAVVDLDVMQHRSRDAIYGVHLEAAVVGLCSTNSSMVVIIMQQDDEGNAGRQT